MAYRLLYLGSRYDYGDRLRGFSHEYRNFELPLQRFCSERGWDFSHYDFHRRCLQIGQALMSEELYEVVKSARPAVLFCVLFDLHVDPYYELFRQVSGQFGVTTVNWFCDDHWRYDDYSARVAPKFDLCCTTSGEALRKYRQQGIGHKVIKSQWACDEQVYRPLDVEQDEDLSFVGQPHGNRREVVAAIRRAGLDIKVFGHGWDRAVRLPFHQMLRMFCRSRVNVNLANSSCPGVPQIKGRNFEVPITGGFLLTSSVAELAECFAIGEEVATFDSTAELVDKARYYLKHPGERRRIAARGRRRALAEHTWRHRYTDIFRAVQSIPRQPGGPAARRHDRFFNDADPLGDGVRTAQAASAPAVTVVIPCYNQAEYLPDAVASVVWQRFRDWELVIVNDGSPDATSSVAHELIARYPHRSIRLVEQENRGLSAARNAGISAAQGRYILPLDADDMLRHDCLERLVDVLEGDAAVDIVYPDALKFGKDFGLLKSQEYDFRRLCAGNQLVYCALYRREVWEKTGGYKEEMREGYEDWEFWISSGGRGFSFRHCPEHLLLYRTKERSMITSATEQGPSLKARIVSLHPDLYSERTRRWASGVLRVPGSGMAGGAGPGRTVRLEVDLSRTRSAGVSFCIITNGRRPGLLALQVASIRRLRIPACEIIVSGEMSVPLPGVRTVAATAAAREGRLGALRNMATAAARHETLVVCDDDILFHQDFPRALAGQRGRNGLLGARVLNLDGTRYWDWAKTSGPGGQELLDYGAEHGDTYVTGGLAILPARLCDEVQWNPDLGYGQCEDVDFTSRIKARGYPVRLSADGTACHCSARYTQVGRRVLTRSVRGANDWLRGDVDSIGAAAAVAAAQSCLDAGEAADAADYLRSCLKRHPGHEKARELWRSLAGGEDEGSSFSDWIPGGRHITLPGAKMTGELRAELTVRAEAPEVRSCVKAIDATTRLPVRSGFGPNALRHATGTLIDSRLHCSPSRHKPGHCVYGPYLRFTCKRDLVVHFDVILTINPALSGPALSLDVYDANADKMVAFHRVAGDTLPASAHLSLRVPFTSSVGQVLEFRLFWHGSCEIIVQGTELHDARTPAENRP